MGILKFANCFNWNYSIFSYFIVPILNIKMIQSVWKLLSLLGHHGKFHVLHQIFIKIPENFFIQVPHKSIAQGSAITIITSGTTTVYVGFEYPGDSGGFEQSLQDSGWNKEEGQILTTDRTMREIYSMNANGATSISLPATTTGNTVMLIMTKCLSKG